MSNEFQLVYPTCTVCKVCRPSVVIGVLSNGQFEFNEGWNIDEVWRETHINKATINDEYGKDYSYSEFVAYKSNQQIGEQIMQGIPDWQRGKDYGVGDEVIYNGQVYKAVTAIYGATIHPDSNFRQCTMHQSLQRQQELEKAEELLTKVCCLQLRDGYQKIQTSSLTDPQLKPSMIPGLPEWWAKRKPKSEREKKLEKIVSALSSCLVIPGGNGPLPTATNQTIAEEILKALETE